ncbi:uncharacterized protein EI97DRAFT_403084 [Westerdykella ornata]|uniref:Beta-hexosaminidase n=1 Tax=Westerdykella ornata TaxID=318751 RepID=A0A6A6JBT1_WESOR|nr:uncharacterized protein EI97DRAFT_403084 [Westerdykella ornata]KAF2273892.1 hypothetical protein EI97DRAFT_403084 [Westerdykella ornata]
MGLIINLSVALIALLQGASAIWPIPTSYEHGESVLFIAEDVSFHWTDTDELYDKNVQKTFQRRFAQDDQWWWASGNVSLKDGQGVTGQEIQDYAIKQTHRTIFQKSFVPWKFHERGWKEPDCKGATYIESIYLELQREEKEEEAVKTRVGDVDESYRLSLTEDGKATIRANSSVGIARGLNTFTQLFFKHTGGGAYTPWAPVEIYDAPVFQHRGLNMDVARQWFPVADIKRMIDAAAYNKMNRFHLHVTDSQSWPLEIPSLPDLAEKGAYRPDLVYSVDDFNEIQRHAAIQGVELITEIDMPGHTSSIWFSRPELIAAYNIQPDWNTYAAEPPSGTLKLNSSEVDDFLETLLDDLILRISPYSTHFHTGGDEVNRNAYELDDTVRSKEYSVLQPLMQKFIHRNHDQVRRLGLTPIVWEEMLLEWNLTLGKDVIVQSWRSDEALAQIVARGHKALAGNYKYWYLDCGKGQWLDFDPSVAADHWPYNDYCAPFHNWRLIYSYDPLAGIPSSHQHLVIGGEAHMWSEQTDPVNLDRMVWPRAAAVAEILWSGAKDKEGRNRSQIEASPRLSEMRERLVAMGVGAEPIQMPYCLMEGTQCQLGYKP